MFRFVLLLFVSTLSAPLYAQCDYLYLDGIRPNIAQDDGTEYCFQEYSVNFSPNTLASTWGAQRLNSESIAMADIIKRKDAFHAESRVPEQYRVQPKEYKKTGYDKGHIVPAGDMSTMQSQAESFSMINMTPQVPENNRRIWRLIEDTVHDLAAQLPPGQYLYVVTGAVYGKERMGRVSIPVWYYKAIYSPYTDHVGVYLSPNDTTETYTKISLNELQQLANVIPFPALPEEQKRKIYLLNAAKDH